MVWYGICECVKFLPLLTVVAGAIFDELNEVWTGCRGLEWVQAKGASLWLVCVGLSTIVALTLHIYEVSPVCHLGMNQLTLKPCQTMHALATK